VTWKPDPAVLVNSTNLTGNTIGNITIRRGRDSVYVEASASYAAVDLISVGEPLDLEVGQRLRVTLNDSTDARRTLFRGRISDIQVQITQATRTIAGYRVTAVGPLAFANRRQVLAAGRAEELDGERALAAVLGGAAQTWETFASDLEWQDAVGVWSDYVGDVDLDLFDAGVYTLAALGSADAGYGALQLAQEAAQSGGGVIYETRGGNIAYADAARRAATLATGGFAEVPAAVLDLDGMRASSALSEVANRVEVEWVSGVESAEVRESVIKFGVLERVFKTILASDTAAAARAEELVQNLSLPVFKADQFRLLLNNVDATLLDDLVVVEPNDGVDFVGLPPELGFTRLTAFVEGIEWRIDPFTVELGLFASDERLSVGGVWFGRVTDTLEWGDVDAGLEWQQVGRTL
jgi:hypothetical protein